MIDGNWYSQIIPVLLSLTHFVGLHNRWVFARKKGSVRSFAAGFSIAYVFLFLLPELPVLASVNGIETFLLSLIGFSVFHISHKLIFNKPDLVWNKNIKLEELHLLTSVMYSFLVTFSLVEIAVNDLNRGILLSLVFVLHIGLIELSEPYKYKKLLIKVKTPLLILATMLGGLLPVISAVNVTFTAILFSLTTGAIIYTAIREELPTDAGGKPWFFMLGVSIPVLAVMVLF